MSDIVETAVEPAPQSTAEIASETFESLETAAEPATEPASDPAPAEPQGEIESLLTEAGYATDRRPDGRENRIPYSKVKRIIENGLKKGRTEWDTTRAQIERERDEYRSVMDSLQQAVRGDERAFLSEIARMDARYARFLEPPAPVAPISTEMPAPDLTLPDGGKTYSVEGLQNLIQWAVDAKLMPKVDERLKPLTAKEQERQQLEHAQQQARHAYSQAMTEAQSWPLFGTLPADGTLTPFQQEVLAELQADTQRAQAKGVRPSMTLRQAYLEVYAKQQAPDKVRERVLAELKLAPKSTSTTRGATDAPKAPGPVSTADVAARILSQMDR